MSDHVTAYPVARTREQCGDREGMHSRSSFMRNALSGMYRSWDGGWYRDGAANADVSDPMET
jgi:hypothetical protein